MGQAGSAVKRGEVWRVRLDPRTGSEQAGVRPTIVVSNDVFNDVPTWNSFVVVPFSTSSRQAVRGPTAVAIAAGTSGLSRESVALCHQITTADRSKFLEKLGQLSEEELRSVEAGILKALRLLEYLPFPTN